jgi:hypothetical protein
MSQQEEDLRFERKAYVDQISRRSLISMVLQHPALFSKIHKERTVNSMYYDTIEFSDALEKINGLKSRKKVRIRWYGNVFGEIRKPILEIKNKENGLGWKERYSLHPFVIEERGESAIQLEFEETESASSSQFIMNRIPSSLVSYRRAYFQTADTRFRLTVDDQLMFYIPLRDGRGWVRIPDNTDGTVIELKYSKDHDEDARQITSWYPFRWGSFSKYTRGLESGGILQKG